MIYHFLIHPRLSLEEELCQLDNFILAYKIQYVLLLHFFLAKKNASFNFSFFMKLALCFRKPSESELFFEIKCIFICYSFIILSKN